MFKLSKDIFFIFFACRKRELELKVLSALYHTPNLARCAGLNNALWSNNWTPCFERLVARPCIEKLITVKVKNQRILKLHVKFSQKHILVNSAFPMPKTFVIKSNINFMESDYQINTSHLIIFLRR